MTLTTVTIGERLVQAGAMAMDMEGQVEDVATDIRVEALKGEGRGMFLVPTNGTRNNVTNQLQRLIVLLLGTIPVNQASKVQLATHSTNSRSNPQLQTLVRQKRKDLSAGGANVMGILMMNVQPILIASFVIRRTHIYLQSALF